MKRIPFEPPTQYYNEKIVSIDEQICALIKQRKDLSKNNPGFPTKRHISEWSKQFELYEDFLNSVFSHLLHEEMYKPVVVPTGFQKNIPILKSYEKEERFYSVTFIRQYENASVVHFNVDKVSANENSEFSREPDFTHFELSIDDGFGTEYDCRNEGGGGSGGHTSFTFVVSPPLSDDISGVDFTFKEYKAPFKNPTGFEFVI